MFRVQQITDEQGRVAIQDPPIARFLFQGTTASWLWLAVRVWVGYQWLNSGWGKVAGGKWLDGTGNSLRPYWENAVRVPETGKPPVTFDWYRGFLQLLLDVDAAPWFSYVIVFGELAVGLGLVTGTFVGLAAAGGLTMNLSFLLAGTTSTNPLLAVLSILLILAWKNAGYVGLDRFLLPALGTPWAPAHRAPRPSGRPIPVARPLG